MKLSAGLTSADESDLRGLLRGIGIHPDDTGAAVSVTGPEPVLAGPLRAPAAGVLALAAQACAISAINERRGGAAQEAWIDARDAVFALNPYPYSRRNGRVSQVFERFEQLAARGHFTTADGRHILFGTTAPRNRDRLLEVLGVANNSAAVAAAVSARRSGELEDAMAAAGVPATLVRTSREWRDSPQGRLLADGPVARVERLAASRPVPLSSLSPGATPLSGLRVLDMTHVVAGPTIGRGLAEYGADVLHITTLNPALQDEPEVGTELRIGKRSAQVELTERSDRAAFERLIRTADVFVQSWRPGVLARHGYPAERIAELNPAIVQVSVSAYGDTGPWGGRGGYDGLALAAIGATAQDADWHGRRDPGLLPVTAELLNRLRYRGLLTDTLTGILGVAVTAGLLIRRAREGGSYRADLTLARVGMWLQDLGEVSPDAEVTGPVGAPRMRRIGSCFGLLEYVAPAIRYSQLDPLLCSPPEPAGSAQARWSDDVS